MVSWQYQTDRIHAGEKETLAKLCDGIVGGKDQSRKECFPHTKATSTKKLWKAYNKLSAQNKLAKT